MSKMFVTVLMNALANEDDCTKANCELILNNFGGETTTAHFLKSPHRLTKRIRNFSRCALQIEQKRFSIYVCTDAIENILKYQK